MRSVLLWVALAGCWRAPTKPQAPVDAAAAQPKHVALRAGPLLGIPGESMEYKVSLRGFTLGNVVVAVGQIGEVEGHRALVVRSRAVGSGAFALFSELTWELKTTLDLDAGEAVADEETADVELVVGHKEHVHHERTLIGTEAYNLHSAAGLLRAWRSNIGDRGAIDVWISDGTIDVELTDAARERIGDMPAARYDGTALDKKYKVSIWISDDESRVPLKMVSQTKWGELTVEMVSYDVAGEKLVNR
ncbi:MAG TPA: DUF3108 domain-containing protein [Kofleriaceae bacterium]|nr:DUF3108 domain-containing protein [Kofleriaceae bacterium]